MEATYEGAGRGSFVTASVAGGVVAGAVILVASARLGGDPIAVAAQDFGEALFALAAFATCFGAARHTGALGRQAWTLLGLSALSWGLGEIAWSVYEVGLGVAAPFPSIADAGFLGAVPLAIAGVLKLPSSPSSVTSRTRAVLDGAIVAGSLMLVMWAFGLRDLYLSAQLAPSTKLLVIAYPASDVVLMTILALTIRRARGPARIGVAILIAAYLFDFLADGSFADLTLRGAYGVLGSLADNAWIVGYLALGLAAIWSLGGSDQVPEQSRVELWQLAMPWVCVLAVATTEAWLLVTDQAAEPISGALAASVAVLFVLSQALTLNDSLHLLDRSRRAEAELYDTAALLREVIARAPVGIGRMGDDLRILDVNQRVTEIFGLSRAAFIGRSIAAIATPDELAHAGETARRLRNREVDAIENEGEVQRGDGSRIWVHRVISAVRTRGGALKHYLAIFEDVTGTHKAQEADAAHLTALEHLNHVKSEFMTMVSHEFRTALTGIQSYSEILAAGDGTPAEVVQFAGEINADARRLNRLITEMLDLDRMEAGRLVMRSEPVDMNQVVSEAVARARVSTTRHALRLDLDPGRPEVTGNPDRLAQVMTNLLVNSIKYSPDGGEIQVTTRLKDGVLEVSVKDHGIGVPQEFLGRIFSRDERYENVGRPETVGTGLGLAICAQIVRLHNGRIWVESAQGEGSTFTFALPARARQSADAPEKGSRVA